MTHLDLRVEGAFFLVQFIIIVRVHFDVVEGEFGFNLRGKYGAEICAYPLLEGLTFCEGEGVRFGNDGDDVDDIRQLLEDHNVDGL